MTLNKCFTDTFNEPLKQAGFAKTGLLYYRVHGSMLQGVFLNTCNPFQICFASFPYWIYDVRKMSTPDIKKGWWTQLGGSMPGFYYNPKTPEKNQEAMKNVLNWFTHTVLVYLDGMRTERDYFDDCFKFCRDLLVEYGYRETTDWQFAIYAGEFPKSEILLHQKYLGNLPMPVESYLDKYFEELLPKRLRNAKTEDDIARETERVISEKSYYLSDIEGVSQNEFLDRYHAMCADMKTRLEEQLKIKISD